VWHSTVSANHNTALSRFPSTGAIMLMWVLHYRATTRDFRTHIIMQGTRHEVALRIAGVVGMAVQSGCCEGFAFKWVTMRCRCC
jgi:hypothetical protein